MELSGSWTVMGEVFEIHLVLLGGADRKWPVAPVSKIMGL